jgi:hypothetical protein
MFKLIGDESKKKVRKEYVLRRGIVMVAALAALVVMAIVALFPAYIISDSQYSEILARSEIIRLSEKQNERADLLTWLKDTNTKLSYLSPELDTDRPIELFKVFLTEENEGIQITSLSWKREKEKDKEKLTFIVSGVASDRQKLIRFESAINTSGKFAKVSLPVSQFAKEKDIDFQMTVTPHEVKR